MEEVWIRHYSGFGITPGYLLPCQRSSRNLVKSRKIATHQNHALIYTSHHAMNRTPLGPIDGNKTYRKELTLFARGFILGKLTSGVTPQIEREIHAPRSTIRSVLRASVGLVYKGYTATTTLDRSFGVVLVCQLLNGRKKVPVNLLN